jgi:hypothetical protein
MHFERTVNTPVFHPERRAVDVNRPVTSLVRSCCHTGRAGTHCYRGIDIPRSPCCVHNRAATVRESGTLLAVKSICTGVSVSTRVSGCHAPCALVRSWCHTGRPGTHRYRGIDIPRSPCPLFCGDVENFNAIGPPSRLPNRNAQWHLHYIRFPGAAAVVFRSAKEHP